jgi:hypothetical protein
MFFTQGYEQSLADVLNNAVFNEDHNEVPECWGKERRLR